MVKYGTSAAGGGFPPASRSRTLNFSDSLPATTQPAVPAPTIHAKKIRFMTYFVR